jgi:hypothetical protein
MAIVPLTKIPGLYDGWLGIYCKGVPTPRKAVQAPSKISKEESKAETATEARDWAGECGDCTAALLENG